MYGWKHYRKPRWARYEIGEIDRERIESKVKEFLSKAVKGAIWYGKWGRPHIPIVVDNEAIGEIWNDVDLNSLKTGLYHYTKRGIKVQLVKDNEVVGFIWLPFLW